MKNYEKELYASYSDSERIKNTRSVLSIAQGIYKQRKYKFLEACRVFERRFMFDIDIIYTESDFEEITLIRKRVIYTVLMYGQKRIEKIEV